MLLWYRPVATALIQPLGWEPPYAAGAALKHTHTHTQNIERSFFVGENIVYAVGAAERVEERLQSLFNIHTFNREKAGRTFTKMLACSFSKICDQNNFTLFSDFFGSRCMY